MATLPAVVLTEREHGPMYRWDAERPIRAFTATLPTGDPVGEIRVVGDGDDFRGLVAWVHVQTEHRGRGYGLAMHAVAAARLGAPLLLDTVALGTHASFDGVSLDELLVWDRMVCDRDWHVSFARNGQLLTAMWMGDTSHGETAAIAARSKAGAP